MSHGCDFISQEFRQQRIHPWVLVQYNVCLLTITSQLASRDSVVYNEMK